MQLTRNTWKGKLGSYFKEEKQQISICPHTGGVWQTRLEVKRTSKKFLKHVRLETESLLLATYVLSEMLAFCTYSEYVTVLL